MDTCICVDESLYCSLEIIAILLIDYTSVQNKKFKLKKYMLFMSNSDIKEGGNACLVL